MILDAQLDSLTFLLCIGLFQHFVVLIWILHHKNNIVLLNQKTQNFAHDMWCILHTYDMWCIGTSSFPVWNWRSAFLLLSWKRNKIDQPYNRSWWKNSKRKLTFPCCECLLLPNCMMQNKLSNTITQKQNIWFTYPYRYFRRCSILYMVVPSNVP